jgi:hypothetical protein
VELVSEELLGGAGDGHTALALLLLAIHVEGEGERGLAQGSGLLLRAGERTGSRRWSAPRVHSARFAAQLKPPIRMPSRQTAPEAAPPGPCITTSAARAFPRP